MSDERSGYQQRRASLAAWDAERVRSLRLRLGLSQQQFADELGVRQQTVSEWETGRYAPRGATARLLGIVAERAETAYAPRRDGPPGPA
jgi:DNA-binding transcriptional regulator YiaG